MCLARVLGLILIGILANSVALAENESYICVAESSVGFIFNKTTNEWERANFKTDGKYILSKSSNGNKWEVKEIGQKFGVDCKDGFDEYGFIHCQGLIDFRMNKESLRYMICHPWGYVVKDYKKGSWLEEGSLTPYLEIGKCSPL